MLSKRSSRYLILKIDQSQNDFGQRQVLIPASVLDIHLYMLSGPLDYVDYDALARWFMGSKRSSRYLILKIDQSQNDFGQRQVLLPTSVIDIQ